MTYLVTYTEPGNEANGPRQQQESVAPTEFASLFTARRFQESMPTVARARVVMVIPPEWGWPEGERKG